MMKMVIEGVMGSEMPWALVFTGVFIAVVMKRMGLPVLPVAIGIYLPIYLSAGIRLGGLVRLLMEKRKYASETEKNNSIQSGILYTSGMIAGEGVVGILLAVFAVIKLGVDDAGNPMTLASRIDLSGMISLGSIGSLVAFGLLLLSIILFCNKGRKSEKN